MKIVKRNEKQAPKKWSGRYICNDCESVLDVEESDLQRYRGFSSRGGETWDYACFVCPCCNESNSVDAPKTVLERLSPMGAGPPSAAGKAKKVILRGEE
jgi:hypothetical protein